MYAGASIVALKFQPNRAITLWCWCAIQYMQPWVYDINESSIWEMVLRAAASSVTSKASARGKLRGAHVSDTSSVVSSRSAVSSASAASEAASVASSRASGRSRAASIAASLASSWSSLTKRSNGSSSRPRSSRRALDSGPRPKQRYELADLPEDEPSAAEATEADARAVPQVPGGEAVAAQMRAGAEAGKAQAGKASGDAQDQTVRAPGLGMPVFTNEGRRCVSLSTSLSHVTQPRPLLSAALEPVATLREPEGNALDDASDAYGGTCVAAGVLTPRSSRSSRSGSSSYSRQRFQQQQLPPARQPAPARQVNEIDGSLEQGRADPEAQDTRAARDTLALLKQSRRVLEAHRAKTGDSKSAHKTDSSNVANATEQVAAPVQEQTDNSIHVVKDAQPEEHGGGVHADADLQGGDLGNDGSMFDGGGSVCGRSTSGFSVLDDVVTQYTESEEGSGVDDFDESSVDASDDERVEAERRQFFQEAYCLRGSDSEDDLADLDQKLEARDTFESKVVRVRRVRRFCRRKVAVSSQLFSWGSGATCLLLCNHFGAVVVFGCEQRLVA